MVTSGRKGVKADIAGDTKEKQTKQSPSSMTANITLKVTLRLLKILTTNLTAQRFNDFFECQSQQYWE